MYFISILLNDHIHKLSSFPFQADFFPIWFNIQIFFSWSIHVCIPLNLFLSREGGKEINIYFVSPFDTACFWHWTHIISFNSLHSPEMLGFFSSHFKDEKLMARNQHAQDHLIRKWQSQNSNKTILLFAFVNDTTFLLLFSRQKFLQIPHRRLPS